MLQNFKLCPEKISAKLLFQSGPTNVSLAAQGDMLKKLADDPKGEISEYMLLEAQPMTVSYNSYNTITHVQRDEETPV